MVADAVIAHLKPIKSEYQRLMSDEGYIQEILLFGSERAKEISIKTMEEVREKLGLTHLSKKLSVIGSRI